MKLWKPLTFSLFMVGILVLPVAATAQTGLGPYQKLSTIVILPNSANGNVAALAGGFDISWFDYSTEMFFIADRGTVPGAGQVDIIDAAQAKFLTAIPGFVGARPGAGVVDLSSYKIVAAIDVSRGGIEQLDPNSRLTRTFTPPLVPVPAAMPTRFGITPATTASISAAEFRRGRC
jgi:hypothetical protein